LFRAGFSVRPLESSTSLSNAGPLASSGFSTSWFDILDFDCLRSITSHGLNTFEYTSHPGDSVDHHFISDVPFYDLDDDDSVIESSIDLIHAPLLSASSPMVDPSSCYLYALGHPYPSPFSFDPRFDWSKWEVFSFYRPYPSLHFSASTIAM